MILQCDGFRSLSSYEIERAAFAVKLNTAIQKNSVSKTSGLIRLALQFARARWKAMTALISNDHILLNDFCPCVSDCINSLFERVKPIDKVAPAKREHASPKPSLECSDISFSSTNSPKKEFALLVVSNVVFGSVEKSSATKQTLTRQLSKSRAVPSAETISRKDFALLQELKPRWMLSRMQEVTWRARTQ